MKKRKEKKLRETLKRKKKKREKNGQLNQIQASDSSMTFFPPSFRYSSICLYRKKKAAIFLFFIFVDLIYEKEKKTLQVNPLFSPHFPSFHF
ncbi:hypothetical protein E2320_013573 [Naja naja]|nr:hypothetical protein E2320_013573 [Naja naja]